MKSCCAVIQGPLVTYGQGPNDAPNGFDTLETIKQNVVNLTDRGFGYVVSTWEPSSDRDSAVLEALLHNQIEVRVSALPAVPDPDHRYKHHCGIYVGIQHLFAEKDYQKAAKIRTDMLMPSAFWEWIAETEFANKLYVSELSLPLYLGDFVYAANRDTMSTFLSSYLAFGERILHPSIVFDTGAKYMWAKDYSKRSFLGVTAYLGKQESLLASWNDFLSKELGVMPKNLWRQMLWRGRDITTVVNVNFSNSTPLHSQSQPLTWPFSSSRPRRSSSSTSRRG